MTFRNAAIVDQAATLARADADVAFRMDEDAFRGFYERTSRMLWAYLARLTGDRQAADDLLQDTYYRFLRANVNLESESHRRHYLFRIATNLSRDRARRHLTQPVQVPHEDDRVATPGEETGAAFDRRLEVAQAMSKLRRRERAMLLLAYAQGASHEEIASIVGVKTGSVKPLLYRARRRLAALLGREAGGR